VLATRCEHLPGRVPREWDVRKRIPGHSEELTNTEDNREHSALPIKGGDEGEHKEAKHSDRGEDAILVKHFLDLLPGAHEEHGTSHGGYVPERVEDGEEAESFGQCEAYGAKYR